VAGREIRQAEERWWRPVHSRDMVEGSFLRLQRNVQRLNKETEQPSAAIPHLTHIPTHAGYMATAERGYDATNRKTSMKREVSLQLMVAKRMYTQGAEHACSNNKLLSGIAVSLFQDSIELALLAAINKNDIDPGRRAEFNTYFELLEKQDIEIPFKQIIRQINNTRIQFKHYGVCPDPSEALRFEEATKAFLDKFLLQCFDLEIEQVSLCSLIEDDDLRFILSRAEANLNSQNITDCLKHLCAAKTVIFSRHARLLAPPLCRSTDRDHGIKDMIRRTIEPLETVAIAGVLGINAFELRKILPLPSASKRPNGDWDVVFHAPFWNSETLRDRDLALEALEILVSISIRTEESLKPVRYGREWMNNFY